MTTMLLTDIPIGTDVTFTLLRSGQKIIRHHTIKTRVVENSKDSCDGCALLERGCGSFACTISARKDGKYVIFKEME